MAHASVYRLSCVSKVTIGFAALLPAGKQSQNFLTLRLMPLLFALDSLYFGFFAPGYQNPDLGQ